VLVGIRPEVAQAMVGLGVQFQHVVTRATLADGITYATSGSIARIHI
jgi:rsbT co-antagonist protein RsbR